MDPFIIKDYFPLQCECIRTTGIPEGVILKFKTFYLKIYDASGQVNGYEVQGYRYDNPQRILHDIVPENQIRSYTKRFKTENYLHGFEFSFYR